MYVGFIFAFLYYHQDFASKSYQVYLIFFQKRMARALSVILVPAFRYNLFFFKEKKKRISSANVIHRTPMKNLNQ
jgi:hypothetical protein